MNEKNSLAVAAGAVAIAAYWVREEEARYDELHGHLNATERAQREAIEDPNMRRETILARGLLREALGGRLGIRARAVILADAPPGKPRVAQATHEPHFCVAHARGLIVIAWSEWGPVEVRVEPSGRRSLLPAMPAKIAL